MATDDQAIGRLEGEVKHISEDLAAGRQRIHELANGVQRVETRLETLVEVGIPQRERMIEDLDAIKASLSSLPSLVANVASNRKMLDSHEITLREHEAFKNKSLGAIGVVGGMAGAATTVAITLLKLLVGIK